MWVRYKCDTCKNECRVDVRKRGTNEPVMQYMKDLMDVVGIHHMQFRCSAETVDLMIPASAAGIGVETDKTPMDPGHWIDGDGEAYEGKL